MWKTSFANTTADELILFKLKRELANLSCKCKICEKSFEDAENTSIPIENCLKVDNTRSQISGKEPCPGCFVAYSLLKSGNKTYKDEDTETCGLRFCADKCIQKTAKGLERTTSITLDSSKKETVSAVFVNDTNTSEERKISKRHIEKVTFSANKPTCIEPAINANCLCLENFIESIRPPLNY